jgi:hypothetical protein
MSRAILLTFSPGRRPLAFAMEIAPCGSVDEAVAFGALLGPLRRQSGGSGQAGPSRQAEPVWLVSAPPLQPSPAGRENLLPSSMGSVNSAPPLAPRGSMAGPAALPGGTRALAEGQTIGLGSAYPGSSWAWATPATQRHHTQPAAVRKPLPAPPTTPMVLPLRSLPVPPAQVPGRHAQRFGAPPPAPRALPQVPVSAARTELPMPRALLSAMSEAATIVGRSESDIWADAAREWLQRHRQDEDPRPPTPGARAPRPSAARDRCWSSIDMLLHDLRAPLPLRARADEPQPLDPAA